MSSGLTHTGAVARGLAYAPNAPRAAVSAATIARAHQQIRDESMAERGISTASLSVASPQDRFHAEIAIRIDATTGTLTAEARQRAYARATGTLVDIRV
jgi:hypothetical protein